jgi:hypothetical protein
MARIRKTANIASILKRTNYRLAHSTVSPDTRRGWASMLETILLEAGLYAGFGYTTDADMERVGLPNEKPGIRYHDGEGNPVTAEEWVADLVHAKAKDGLSRGYVQEFPDESRRFYYVHVAIHADYRNIEEWERYHCNGCGREEYVCSQSPCPAVIEDRNG